MRDSILRMLLEFFLPSKHTSKTRLNGFGDVFKKNTYHEEGKP